MKASPILGVILAVVSLSVPACSKQDEPSHEAHHKILATNPQSESVTLGQEYVCRIHSQRHIDVRALEQGYLKAVKIKEGQPVKKGDLLFQVVPVLYQKEADAEMADGKLAQLTKKKLYEKLYGDEVVSMSEVKLLPAKPSGAQANAESATAESVFAAVKAPFDGIVDRLHCQQGSLIDEGEILTTLSDNSVMWVYFNFPEARYLEYMANVNQHKDDLKIELMLADASRFNQLGKIGAIEADFNNENGNIPFRADFPNPDRLLRHGQTGTVVISRVQRDAVVIPQRATFEVQAKRFVYVIDKDNVAHQREVAIQNELEDLFVVKRGVGVNDKIVLEGLRQVHDGDTLEYEYRPPEKVAEHLKYHAE